VSTYRLFPATDGPPAATSYSGNYLAGVACEVTQWGMWFEGYWWWVCSTGQQTGPVECALWQNSNTDAGLLIAGSQVTSGTLTAGAWNWIPLTTPLPLSAGVTYVPACGYVSTAGFPLTNSQFGSGDPYSAGIVNGPLTAYSDVSGSNPVPGNWLAQGLFQTASPDPAVQMPNEGSNSGNFWMDLQVSDTAPAGAAYRLWPSLPRPLGTISDTAADYTLATEFTLSQSCTLDYIWFYSPPGASGLPTECGIYGQASQALVSGTHDSSPSWSGAAGSGWVSCSYSGVTLPAASYRVAVANADGTAGVWNDATIGYFSTGPGGAGISADPLSAPSEGSADSPGQGSYNAGGSLTWPGTYDTGGAPSYWVDVQVTPASTTPVSDSGTGTGTDSGLVAASLPGADPGSGADTATIRLPGPDSGSGADTGTIAAALTGADAGGGADTSGLGLAGADAGSGTDAGTLTAAMPAADTGSGTDAGSPGASLSGPETGSGADAGSATTAGSVMLTASQLGGSAVSTNTYGGSAQ